MQSYDRTLKSGPAAGDGVVVRPMVAAELPQIDRLYRLAFGTEFGLADPMSFRGDAGLVAGRFEMYPDGCFVAVEAGAASGDAVLGFAIANRWGSVGFLGPVCVHPDHWRRGLARRLVERCVKRFDAWGCDASGLFTIPSSPRHLRLYQQFGFWPRQLTMVMSRRSEGGAGTSEGYRSLLDTPLEAQAVLREAGDAANRLHPGLDLGPEISGLLALRLGDVLYSRRDDHLDFALCHFGRGSEGGSETLYVKFALAAPGAAVASRFERLVAACLARAAELGIGTVVAGINTRQHEAYRLLLKAGFRAEMHGIRMNRPYRDLLDEETSFTLGDWR